MSNKIVQLENESGDNLYPIAGGALTGSISKTMLEEGIFAGPELSEPSSVAYVATDNIQDGAVTSDKIDYTTSTVAITIGGKSATANKVDLGGGLVYIGGHITLSNFTTDNSATNIGLEGLPAMSTVISCGIEGAQIGQAGSYISYPHFYADCHGASFYLRNTTSGTTSAIEINFHVFGVLSTS